MSRSVLVIDSKWHRRHSFLHDALESNPKARVNTPPVHSIRLYPHLFSVLQTSTGKDHDDVDDDDDCMAPCSFVDNTVIGDILSPL